MLRYICILAALTACVTSAPDHEGSDDHHHDIDYYAEPHYEFEYEVHDPHSHDVKSAHETRKGDEVKGYYKVLEADGSIREVHYTADKHNGFNAHVTRTGHSSHPAGPSGGHKHGDDHEHY